MSDEQLPWRLRVPTARQCLLSLDSAICPACGRAKKRGQTLCRREFIALPQSLRNDLYRRVGAGYEKAVALALDFLEEPKFIEQERVT